MRVSKWGNSLAIRLPSNLVKNLSLKEGDKIDITNVGMDSFRLEKKMSKEEALKNLYAFRGMEWLEKFIRDNEYER